MKLNALFESQNHVEFISPHGDDGEVDVYPLLDQAEKLITARGLHLLRNDEISEMAVVGDRVVGVLYNGFYDNEMTSSIVVHPDYEGKGLAKKLFSRIPFDEDPRIDTHVCEVLPPYTMEPFLKKNGYTRHEDGETSDIKIYRKSVENSWF